MKILEKVEIRREKVKFLKPAKLVFKVNISGRVLELEVEFDRFSIVYYQEPNYGDDKILTKMFAEYIQI